MDCVKCGATPDEPCQFPDYREPCTRVLPDDTAKAKEATSGRPADYDPALHNRLMLKLVKAGLTIAEIAEAIGVPVSLLYQWQLEHSSFLEAWQSGEEQANDARNRRVRDSLLRRATGYDYTEERPSKEGVIEVRLHQPADVKAAETWLMNRDPENWKPPAQRNINFQVDNPLEVLFEEMHRNPRRVGPFGALNQLESLNEQYRGSPAPSDGRAGDTAADTGSTSVEDTVGADADGPLARWHEARPAEEQVEGDT
jgi:transposase-like protein